MSRKGSLAAASIGLGFALVLSLVLLSTCQKGGGGGAGGAHSEDATALSGTWSTGCQADAAKAGYFSRDTRTFDGATFATVFESFTDSVCKTSLMSQTQTGAFVIGEPLADTGATELDITIGAIAITLHTDGLVQSYNAKKFCGGGWEKDQVRTLTRSDCSADDSTATDLVYEIFQAKDGALLFGKKDASHTGKSPAQRPQAIDESRPFTKS